MRLGELFFEVVEAQVGDTDVSKFSVDLLLHKMEPRKYNMLSVKAAKKVPDA